MKANRKLAIAAALLLLSLGASAQVNNEDTRKGLDAITENVLKSQLGFLASDWLEGRETGEKGEYISADYIASMLQFLGVAPGGDLSAGPAGMYAGAAGMGSRAGVRERSYFQNFQLTKSMPGELQTMSVVTATQTD